MAGFCCAAFLSSTLAGCAVETSAGDSVAGGGGTSASGSGGRGGGSGGAGGQEEREVCRDLDCTCVPDCCSTAWHVDPEYDPSSDTFSCPVGTHDYAQCDPADCACPQETKITSCVQNCCNAIDYLMDAECVNGEWHCPAYAPFEHDSCDRSTCSCESLRMFAGDTCAEDGSLYCSLTEEMIASQCGTTVCQTCDGFDPSLQAPGCVCTCKENGWVGCLPAP